jgi:hypothetical protein
MTDPTCRSSGRASADPPNSGAGAAPVRQSSGGHIERDEHPAPPRGLLTGSRASRPATDADLARIRSEMLVHPDGHGVILVPVGDPLRYDAAGLRGRATDLTVDVYADDKGVFWPASDADVRLTAGRLADLLGGRAEFWWWANRLEPNSFSAVVVVANRFAAAFNAAARPLATTLGLPVVAPAGPVVVHPTGDAVAHVQTNGRWVRVEPYGTVSDIALAKRGLLHRIVRWLGGVFSVLVVAALVVLGDPAAPSAAASSLAAAADPSWFATHVPTVVGVGAVAAATAAVIWFGLKTRRVRKASAEKVRAWERIDNPDDRDDLVARYWQPPDLAEIALRDGIIASHLPGREPVLRFAPGVPISVVDGTAPVKRRSLLRGPAGRAA